MRRPKNQDAYAAVLANDDMWTLRGHLFVVADGMGAHAAGELASRQAVDEVVQCYETSTAPTPPEALLAALHRANFEIHRRGNEETQLYNMGTTCSTLTLLPEGAVIAHVGDSRVYRCRAGHIQQLTFDHSLVWEMRAAGQISRSDERNSVVPRNVITRCLGPQAEVKVDLEGPFSVRRGDVFLLCSDGLTGRVLDEEIGAILGHLPPREAAQLLVDLANLRGGNDNVTVVVVQVVGDAVVSVDSSDVAWPRLAKGPDVAPSRQAGDSYGWLALGLAVVAIVLAITVAPTYGWQLVAVGLAALATAVAMLLGTRKRWLPRPHPDDRSFLGKGPYEDVSCPLDARFVKGLTETFASVLDGLTLDQAELELRRQEVAELKTCDLADPTRFCQHCRRTAERLMEAVREEARAASSDSSVELL